MGKGLRTGNLPLAMDTALALPHLQEFIPVFCDLDDVHKVPPINDALRIFVRNFRHPITTREPPIISYNEQKFEPVQDTSGKFWVYSRDQLEEEFDETACTTDEDWPDNFNPVKFFWDYLGGDHGSEVVYPVLTDSEEELDN
ncbi:hypothetical protein BJ165DRAFT_1528301 [Panaeolus papilionaceus]|nr:hypothetical protein BJ165DRAFT_1528301 [Panaeolus papilionaceus]